jgi:polyamine oxidase
LDVLQNAMDAFSELTIAAGARLPGNLVDLSARAGYALIGMKPKTPHEMASEYFAFDFTYAQTPEQSSFLASAWVRHVSCGRLIALLTVPREATSHIT